MNICTWCGKSLSPGNGLPVDNPSSTDQQWFCEVCKRTFCIDCYIKHLQTEVDLNKED